MEKESKLTLMVTFMKETSLTVCQKDMESTNGLMDPRTKEISSKDTEMAMVFGNLKIKKKLTKGSIYLIKNMAMEFTKKTTKLTKDTILRI